MCIKMNNTAACGKYSQQMGTFTVLYSSSNFAHNVNVYILTKLYILYSFEYFDIR